MSETEKPAKKPGKMKKLLLLGGLLLVIGGGGVGAGLYATGGGLKAKGQAAPVDPNQPQLVVKDGVEPSEAARFASSNGDVSPDPKKFKASYYRIADNFTANLADGETFVQVGLGVSTYYDERVFENVKLHEMAVRSAVLMTLTGEDPTALSTPEGKLKLQQTLKKAVNEVLKDKEGFGGIDDVYFTSFVIQ
jgi:flagellar protein FliL